MEKKLFNQLNVNDNFDYDQLYQILGKCTDRPFNVRAEDYVTNNSMKIRLKESNLSINLIQDGEVIKDNLLYINKDIKWLNKVLKEKGYSIKDILLLIYNSDKDIIIYNYKKSN